MRTEEIRRNSLRLMSRARLLIPSALPLLDDELCLRDKGEALSRLLCMNALAAAWCGFDFATALAWLKREEADALLTESERTFLETGKPRQTILMAQVEGAWALNFVADLDFWKDCDDKFVTLLPDLKVSESGEKWRLRARFREAEEVVAACDLAYCLHWAIRQAETERKPPPGGLKPYLVVERRRA